MRKKTLAFKLNFSVSLLILLIFSVGIYSVIMINKTQEFSYDTGTNWLPGVKAIAEISENFGNLTRRHALILGELATKVDKGEIEKNIKVLNNFSDEIEKEFNNIKKYLGTNEEKVAFDNIIKSWEKVKDFIKTDLELAQSGKIKESWVGFNENTIPAFFNTTDAIDNLGDINTKGSINSTKNGEYFTSLTNFVILITGSIALVISFIFLGIIKKSTSAIEHVLEDLKSQSVATSEIATSLKSSSDALSSAVSNQAAAVHETTAAINEITSMVNRTVENVNHSTNVAKSASKQAEEGQTIMKKLVHAMETIQESSGQLQNISEIIKQISTKTVVINDIVSKTELLSLNASIESARAGEYGKGFAVVAEEVGKLAKISGKSAQEIQDLITKSEEQVNVILDHTKERVENGKNVTEQAQKSFIQISQNILDLSNVVGQIADASREQEIGVKQISTAMGNINKATQTSQVSVNTTTDTAKSLVTESEKLRVNTTEVEHLIAGN